MYIYTHYHILAPINIYYISKKPKSPFSRARSLRKLPYQVVR